MNKKITVEEEGRCITIEDEDFTPLNVVTFTLDNDNLNVNVIEGCDDYVECNLSKKEMTYLIDNLIVMRDTMVEVEEADVEYLEEGGE